MISVITPVYNGEKFIEFCLQTVIQQQCAEVEHIIVDGGSQDRTIEIVQRYAQQYSHIRWKSEKDQGQSDAMNKGIRMAKGAIITFLNVDDYYEPNVLNQVIEHFKKLPDPSFLVGNCNIWDDSNWLIEVNRPSKLRLYDLVLGVSIHPFPCNPSAYFYHASLHDRVGFYDPEEHYVMDLDFILRAVQVATVQYVDQTWGNYRRIKGTKTYEDLQKGVTHARVLKLLRKYRRSLTLIEKIKRLIWQQQQRLAFMLKQPQHLPLLIKSKLLKTSV